MEGDICKMYARGTLHFNRQLMRKMGPTLVEKGTNIENGKWWKSPLGRKGRLIDYVFSFLGERGGGRVNDTLFVVAVCEKRYYYGAFCGDAPK